MFEFRWGVERPEAKLKCNEVEDWVGFVPKPTQVCFL